MFGPGNVICDVRTEEFEAVGSFHSSSIGAYRTRVYVLGPCEDHHNLLGFIAVRFQVVDGAPGHQVLKVISGCSLVIVGLQ